MTSMTPRAREARNRHRAVVLRRVRQIVSELVELIGSLDDVHERPSPRKKTDCSVAPCRKASIAESIRTLFRENVGQEFSPKEVWERLDRGSRPGTVHSWLQRLHNKRDTIRRVDPGRYVYIEAETTGHANVVQSLRA